MKKVIMLNTLTAVLAFTSIFLTGYALGKLHGNTTYRIIIPITEEQFQVLNNGGEIKE